MLFSIVIPTYNRVALIPQTLESVRRQTYTDFELIVVDDGSTDGTTERLKLLGDEIQLFAEPNLGPGAARNLGMREARGDYVVFLDSDDLWFEWTLATFADLIRQHDRPAILAASLIEFRHDAELSRIKQEPITAEYFEDYFASYRAGYFVGAGMSVLRRDILLASGGFTEDRANAEDHDLILRLGTAAGFVQAQSPLTLGWRRHSNSETGNVQSTAAGVLRLLRNERLARYPGGTDRDFQRRVILTSHARPASMACLRHASIREAWRIYLSTLVWHLRQGRWRFLLAFPFLSLLVVFRSLCRVAAI